MAWDSLPEALAAADRSLSSVITVTLEENLDRVYEQSCWGLGALGDADYWTRAIIDADTWEPLSTGFDTWPGMPVPLRSKRDGAWRGVTVRAQIKADHNVTVRAYLLASPAISASAVIADPEGFTGVDSYDEVVVTGDGTYYDCELDIVPEGCEVRNGDGTVSGLALPIAWLHWIVQSATAGTSVTIRAPSPEETL